MKFSEAPGLASVCSPPAKRQKKLLQQTGETPGDIAGLTMKHIPETT